MDETNGKSGRRPCEGRGRWSGSVRPTAAPAFAGATERVEDISARAFAAAQAMVGVRFRPQGCDPATGLDCVGLVWAAYAAAGRRLVRPVGYPLRGWPREWIEAGLTAAGFEVAGDGVRDGDVALIIFDAGQFHLGLIGLDTMIHAHAGLRRVVETPLDGLTREAVRWRLAFAGPPRCD